MNFDKLVASIQSASSHLQQDAVKAINIRLTFRNWLVGFYIVEYEQNGEDRAQYGQQLLATLAREINIKGLGETNLKLCRQFYLVYPEIHHLLSGDNNFLIPYSISQTLSDKLQFAVNDSHTKSQTASDESGSNFSEKRDYLLQLLASGSFSHFIELIKIDDDTKRKFFELLVIKTTPTVRELQRQINTLTFERFGLSQNKESVFGQIRQKITPQESADLIKSHYFFEFLNLNQPTLIEESDLEQALINQLHEFILELGYGFCFEARQKRILIGDEYYFIDLVFYHRILKCHVLIELKTEKVNHEHIGQLKTYLNFYKKNICQPADNPPVGILLVTKQNKTLVEYAVADSDQDIFVSEYLLQLPDKEQLAAFINRELRKL
jgi:predicted nuclease of restriction endonuclease-like (RecB) superfamily